MSQPKGSQSRRRRSASLPPELEHVHLNAAGIDVGAEAHFVAVPPNRDPNGQEVREFGAFTADLYALADWLAQCGIETVAMESTGVYWIPLFEVLESAASRSSWSIPATSRTSPAVRPMSSTANGFNNFILTACSRALSDPTTRFVSFAVTCASVPCWCVTPRITSSTCKKLSS